MNDSSKTLVALISGSRGLAKTLIETFLGRGHRVSVLIRDPSQATHFEGTANLHIQIGDLTDPTLSSRWATAALKSFGRIDCLVNNAAIQGPGGKFETLKFDEVQKTIEADLIAPLRMVHVALPLLSNRGTVINLSGGGATAARPNFLPYAVSKCALVRATETLAKESEQIRFFAVAPGTLKTQMTESILKMGPEAAGTEYGTLQKKLNEGGDGTERAAKLVVWLAENRPATLSGRLISAIWDDYEGAATNPHPESRWTLRRVDDVLLRQLNESRGEQ